MPLKKIILYRDIDTVLPERKNNRVLVGGCFDIVHIGHIRFLHAAKKQGNMLIIALESDEFIQKRKHRQPFHTQEERAEVLASLSDVDLIILLPYFTTDEQYDTLVREVKPNIIAITEHDPQLATKQKQATSVKGKVAVVTSYVPHKASGSLLKALEKME